MQPMGGFPPLVSKNKKVSSNQKELKPQFFAETRRENINVRELINSNASKLELTSDETLSEVETL